MNEIKNIEAEELKNKIDTNPNLTVINVLSKEAYDDCHIKNSINIPLDSLENKLKDWDRNKEIIVYCAHIDCPASKKAFNLLQIMGFKNIRAFEGGMKEWHQKNYPSEGSCNLEYLKK